jgi:ABC-type dipeptide/oligopeptide/nickel transport system permease subunit
VSLSKFHWKKALTAHSAASSSALIGVPVTGAIVSFYGAMLVNLLMRFIVAMIIPPSTPLAAEHSTQWLCVEDTVHCDD